MESDSGNLSSNEPQAEAVIKLEAIFRAIPVLLFCLDSSGQILSYDVGKPSSLYHLPELFLGQQIQAVLPPAVGQNFFRAIQEALQTGKVISMDYQLQVPGGQRWFEARLVSSAESQVIAIIRDVTDRVTASEQAQRQLQRLSALHSIDAASTSSFDLNVIMSVILRQITGQLGVDAADILLLSQRTRKLEFAAGHGFLAMTFQPAGVMIGQGYAGTAALERRTVSVPTLDDQQAEFLFTPGLAQEKFASYYAIPLIAKGQVNGVLEIYHRSILQPADDWFEFLATLAGQTALAIDSASLFHDLQRSNIELTMAYDAAIESWSRALEISGRETREHTQRVAHWTVQLAGALHIEEKDLNDLRRGALLHDIGKLVIPESILNKPGPLDASEWEITKRHPGQAYEFLAPIKYLSAALDIPRYHHERWDGSGYPGGLRGTQIPLSARIFAVVDVHDALITAHPYRPAWTEQAARAYIQEQSGILFDPIVAKVFLQIISYQ
ncbi:MAG: HD domain-containing protein [Chloroflexi bacterium]|nr:HD domain-containing protein [Chloroflexota bacterium]